MKKARRYLLVMLSLAVIAMGSAVIGAKFGYEYARKKQRQRSNPEAWHRQAMRVLEERLDLADDQRDTIQTLVNQAVDELKTTRERTLEESGAVVDQLFSAVDAELTPQQQIIFRDLIRDRPKLKRGIIDEKLKPNKKSPSLEQSNLPAKKVAP
ncbi:MAG: hypothetical protein ACPGVU_23875 [Limisphaerales bacterium]